MPGDTVTFKVKLLAPIAMEQGLNFAIREGGRTVEVDDHADDRRAEAQRQKPAVAQDVPQVRGGY